MENKACICPTMELNNLSTEYNFSQLEYIFDNIGFQIPKFQATCTIKKDSDIFVCTGEAASTKKQAKHNASGKVLLILKTKYEFSDEKVPDKNNHERIVLYKWTNSCEKCYSRYHVAEFCNGPKDRKSVV